MNEIISGMKVVKIYTWEKPFAELVTGARRWVSAKSFQNLLDNVSEKKVTPISYNQDGS